MTAEHTTKAVYALLAADPGVPRDLRTAVVSALESCGAVNLREASRILNVHRATLWRMRRDGRANLPRVGVVGRDYHVSLSAVMEQLRRGKS